MRINHHCRLNDGTPNALFRWMGPLRNSLFEQRRLHDAATYVHNPEIESDVISFTTGVNRGAIGLLVGPVGIGKSTLLSHFCKTVWSGSTSICDAIIHDCSGQNFSRKLGLDFDSKDILSKRLTASAIASEAICIMLRGHYSDYLDSRKAEFVEFIRKSQRGLIQGFIAKGGDDTYLINVLERAENTDPIGYWSCVVLFSMLDRGMFHVKYIIDNVDDKNVVLVTQFVEEIGHFQRRINEIATKIDAARFRFTPILSCRPTTLHRVHQVVDADPDHVGQGWVGITVIEMDRTCSISEALQKRYIADSKALDPLIANSIVPAHRLSQSSQAT